MCGYVTRGSPGPRRGIAPIIAVLLVPLAAAVVTAAPGPTISTKFGSVYGIEQAGVNIFKG